MAWAGGGALGHFVQEVGASALHGALLQGSQQHLGQVLSVRMVRLCLVGDAAWSPGPHSLGALGSPGPAPRPVTGPVWGSCHLLGEVAGLAGCPFQPWMPPSPHARAPSIEVVRGRGQELLSQAEWKEMFRWAPQHLSTGRGASLPQLQALSQARPQQLRTLCLLSLASLGTTPSQARLPGSPDTLPPWLCPDTV